MPARQSTSLPGFPILFRLVKQSTVVLALTAVFYLALVTTLSLTIVGGDTLASRVMPLSQAGGKGFTLQRMQEFETLPSSKLLIVGPSQSYRTFDTRLLARGDRTVFNLGTTAQTPVNAISLLEEHLQQGEVHEVVLVVSQHALTSDGLESLADLVSNLPVTRHTWKMAWEVGGITSLNLTVAAAMRDLFRPIQNTTQRSVDLDNYVPGGYVETQRPLRDLGMPDGIRLEFLPRQLNALRQCVNYVRSQGALCRAVTTPLNPGLIQKITNYEDNTMVICALLRDLDVPYLDLNSNFDWEYPKHFFDDLHLNSRGAELATRQFDAWLSELPQ